MKKKWDKQGHKLYLGMPEQSPRLFILLVILSVLFHLWSVDHLADFAASHPRKKPSDPVKVKISYKPQAPEKKSLAEKDREAEKKFAETKLPETEQKPINPRYYGAQDHRAEKETKVIKKDSQDALLNPGEQGSAEKTAKAQQQQKQATKQEKPQKQPERSAEEALKHIRKPSADSVTAPDGKVSIGTVTRAPRNSYEALLPTQDEMADMRSRGYLDNISDDLASGDKIDLNTTNYRYIGYMSGFRKAFYMVWTYPGEAARRGLQGVVVCEFTIHKDGSIKNIIIRRTSGYQVLDQAVVEALRLTSPHNPLPESMPKKPLTIVGSFSYALTNYAGN